MALLLVATACTDKTPPPGPSATEVPLEVSMSDEGPPAYSTPALTITARELLARSDAAMREVEYLRVFTTGEGEPDPRGWGFYLDESREGFTLARLASVDLATIGGVPTWRSTNFLDEAGRVLRGYFLFDRSGEAAEGGLALDGVRPDEVRVVGEDMIDGSATWVVWYHYTLFGIEGPVTTWTTEWIDRDTLYVLRQETNNDDGYGNMDGLMRIVFTVNQPDLQLSVPVELPEAELRRFTETLVVNASADSYIQGDRPEMNFGTEDRLVTDGTPWYRSLVRFDVKDLPRGVTVASVRLGLWLRRASSMDLIHVEGSSTRIGAVHETAGVWLEDTVSFENAPQIGSEIAKITNTDGFPSRSASRTKTGG